MLIQKIRQFLFCSIFFSALLISDSSLAGRIKVTVINNTGFAVVVEEKGHRYWQGTCDTLVQPNEQKEICPDVGIPIWAGEDHWQDGEIFILPASQNVLGRADLHYALWGAQHWGDYYWSTIEIRDPDSYNFSFDQPKDFAEFHPDSDVIEAKITISK